jgi:hypothetical protein
MSNDQVRDQTETNNEPTNEGLRRRDILMSGTSLVAVSALSAVGLTSPARAQQCAFRGIVSTDFSAS